MSETKTRSVKSAVPRPLLGAIRKGLMRYTWRGVLCNKSPFDLALYSLLLWREKPRAIIEIGTKEGGSALWLWDTCHQFGLDTEIISIDIQQRAKGNQTGITFLQGNALNLATALPPERTRTLKRPLMVIEDSAHRPDTTLAVLQFMDAHLRSGEYIIIEDGIVDSRGVAAQFGGGPNPAVEEFLAANVGRYEIDTDLCDYYGYNVTWNTNGWLRKIAD